MGLVEVVRELGARTEPPVVGTVVEIGSVGASCVGIGTGGRGALMGARRAVHITLPLPEPLLAGRASVSFDIGWGSASIVRLTAELRLQSTYHEDQRTRFLDVVRTNGLVVLQGFASMMAAPVLTLHPIASERWENRIPELMMFWLSTG
jgi:hypothetical protein